MLAFATASELAQALHRASEAHHEYEQALSQKDEDWETWYANFLAEEQPWTAGYTTFRQPLGGGAGWWER